MKVNLVIGPMWEECSSKNRVYKSLVIKGSVGHRTSGEE